MPTPRCGPLAPGRPIPPDAEADQPDIRQRLARAPAAHRRAGRQRLARGRGDTLLVAPRAGLLTRVDARSGRTLEQRTPTPRRPRPRSGSGARGLPTARPTSSSASIPRERSRRSRSAGAVRDHGRAARRLGRERADGTVKPIDPANGSVITTIPVGSVLLRSRPTATASGWQTAGTARRPDRRAQQQGHREGRGRRKPAGVGGRRRQGLGQRPDASGCPAERGNRRRERPLVRDRARPCGQFDAGEPGRVRDLRTLLTYPDEPGTGGLRLVPDAARALPTVSKDGRSYTFTIRPGMRFSPPSNQPVTAQTFKHTIERSVDPRMKAPPGQMFLRDVVGAPAYMAARPATSPGSRRRATGSRLTSRRARRTCRPGSRPRCSAPSRPTCRTGPS